MVSVHSFQMILLKIQMTSFWEIDFEYSTHCRGELTVVGINWHISAIQRCRVSDAECTFY
jgi:hypothetical protein